MRRNAIVKNKLPIVRIIYFARKTYTRKRMCRHLFVVFFALSPALSYHTNSCQTKQIQFNSIEANLHALIWCGAAAVLGENEQRIHTYTQTQFLFGRRHNKLHQNIMFPKKKYPLQTFFLQFTYKMRHNRIRQRSIATFAMRKMYRFQHRFICDTHFYLMSTQQQTTNDK